jgi:uroporphyrinogen decarboxylase
MTSRERLLASLNFREPNRVPLDLASTQVTGISLAAYNKLCDHIEFADEQPRICDAIQQIVIPHNDLLQRFGVDTRGLWPRMNHTDFVDEDAGDYMSHIDEWGFAYRMKKSEALWYDLYASPLENSTLSKSFIDNYSWPKGDDESRIEGLRDRALALREQGYAVVLKSICAGLFEMMIRLRGMQNAMMDLLADPVHAGLILDKILEHKMEYWDMALTELGDVVDVVAEGDDFGTQTSQLISIYVFREIFKPRQAEMIKLMHQKAPHAAVFFHSCGNVRELLPDFIDMGIDIINPVHITASGMEPRQLKKDFGKDIVFWGGGIDTQDVLPHGTPQKVSDHVKRSLDVFAPGGGFVFNTIHNIQADVPPENIAAMYETLAEYGKY